MVEDRISSPIGDSPHLSGRRIDLIVITTMLLCYVDAAYAWLLLAVRECLGLKASYCGELVNRCVGNGTAHSELLQDTDNRTG